MRRAQKVNGLIRFQLNWKAFELLFRISHRNISSVFVYSKIRYSIKEFNSSDMVAFSPKILLQPTELCPAIVYINVILVNSLSVKQTFFMKVQIRHFLLQGKPRQPKVGKSYSFSIIYISLVVISSFSIYLLPLSVSLIHLQRFCFYNFDY